MTDYQIIESNSQSNFKSLVNEKLLEGYIFIGGVNVTRDEKYQIFYYHQAVARSIT